MLRISYPELMSHLKSRLKELKISYGTLAKTMDMPESTLKKWFSATDGSFNRITSLCEAMGITLESVVKGMEEQKLKSFTFSKEHQSHFLKDKISFAVYWLMVYERKSKEKIMIQLNLSEEQMRKILFILDRLNLIQLGSQNKVKIPRMRPIYWKFSGRFMEEIFEEWTKQMLDDSQDLKNSDAITLQFFQLSEKSRANFLREVQELEEKYARITILELNQKQTELSQVRYLRVSVDGSFVGN
jgi:hypothetical protein